VAFSSSRAPEALDTIARIQVIPVKKRPRPEISYLTDDGVQALLDAINSSSSTKCRDRALFTLAAQTGLRINRTRQPAGRESAAAEQHRC
jgi:integrase